MRRPFHLAHTPSPPVGARLLIAAVAVLCGVFTGCSGGKETAQQQDGATPRKAVTPVVGGSPVSSAPEVTQTKKGDHSPKQMPKPATVYRPGDSRPRHDDAALAEIGIHLYESQRLKLYTDVPAESARPLPALMDRAYAAWEEYFGPLPPNRQGSAYQMTGYIMRDRRLFLETGLLPEDLPIFPHGRHRGAVFWMNDQEHDYYRRHLMVHEGTHCFMTTMPQAYLPSWYMEGMAELFGTHHTDEAGRSTFRIMPGRSLDVRGWGRLQIIAHERAAGRGQSLDEIFAYGSNGFLKTEKYAWSWALCKFLDGHPRYRERFRELRDYQDGTEFVREFQELFLPDQVEMNRDWAFFAADLSYGFDVERSVIEFKPAQGLGPGEEIEFEVAADRGWQSSGVAVERGGTYQISATQTVVLARKPRPWESEADGVTIRYHAGRPLGRLMMRIVSDQVSRISVEVTHSAGKSAEIVAEQPGTLYFRVNDFWGELADNSGAFHVRVKRAVDNTLR